MNENDIVIVRARNVATQLIFLAIPLGRETANGAQFEESASDYICAILKSLSRGNFLLCVNATWTEITCEISSSLLRLAYVHSYHVGPYGTVPFISRTPSPYLPELPSLLGRITGNSRVCPFKYRENGEIRHPMRSFKDLGIGQTIPSVSGIPRQITMPICIDPPTSARILNTVTIPVYSN